MNKHLFKLLSFVFLLALALHLLPKSAFAETTSTEATGFKQLLSQPLQTLELKMRFGKPAGAGLRSGHAIAMTWTPLQT